MPTTLNSFFRQNSPRRLSNVGKEQQQGQQSVAGQGASKAESEATSSESERRSDESKPTTLASSSSIDQPLGPTTKPKAQHSLPPIATTAANATRDIPTKSSSVPSIELVSPSGSNQRHIWSPDEGSDRNSNASPPLGVFGAHQAFGTSAEQHFSSISPRQDSVASFASPTPSQTTLAGHKHAEDDDEDDHDPLFSLAPAKQQRKMARPSSSQGKGRGESLMNTVKRGGKGEVPDRHDIMRKAMADAVGSDTYGKGGGNDVRTEDKINGNAGTANVSLNGEHQRRPSLIDSSMAKSSAATPFPTSQSTGTIIDHDKPGNGSLTFDHFNTSGGEGEVVLADAQTNQAESAALAKSSSQEKKPGRILPSRPKLGSRNNSFQSDVDATENVRDSPTRITSTLDPSVSPSTSPVKQKGSNHARYATTGHTAESARPKQTSLAVPNSSGSLDVRNSTSDAPNSSSLLPTPLNRFRRLSDAGSISGKRGASPSGGIAGALAASGLAGMGVGHAELLQRSQAQLSEREAAAAAAAASHKKNRSRAPSSASNNEYASGFEGGMYRDPVTGKMVERGPDGQDHPEDPRPRLRSIHTRSVTNLSSTSMEGSDISAGSGLNAAANFALGLQDAMLMPEDPLKQIDGHSAAPLTPGGIGAVGGLSPSGLGERVSLADNEWDTDDMSNQITGFAVASSKRNAEFHAQFPAVPEDDYLIEDYGCALVREILIQGRLFVSENHVCFYANIFGWVTNIVMPFSEIVSVEKRMTAYVIPNAIQIATLHSKSTFASFLSRDTTYDLIVNIWKLSHPSLRPSETFEMGSEDESVDGADGATVIVADDEKGKQEEQTPAKKSKRKLLKKKLGIKDGTAAHALADGQMNGTEGTAAAVAGAIARGKSPGLGAKREPHRKTMCLCEKEKKHFTNVVLETTYPTVPEKIYNLIFTSGFMKDFWTDNQKLLDLHMSDWAPNAQNQNKLSRDISYIKPLSGGFGPKQTKCLLTDENINVDFDEYVTMMTTTRTPDVPSGGSFAVKTRTCITWAGGGNTARVLVTCTVEWSGRSMLKSVIDRACIDGQKQYYTDLDKAIRVYIKEHASEFREEGEDPEAAVAAIAEQANGPAGTDEKATDADTPSAADASQREKAGLAKYMDTLQPVIDLVSGAIGGLAELSPTVLILGGVVLLLVVSNLWALSSSSHSGRDPLDPHRLRQPVPTRGGGGGSKSPTGHGTMHGGAHFVHEAAASADAVAMAVRDVLRDYFEPHGHHGSAARVVDSNKSSPKLAFEGKVHDPAEEVTALLSLLDDVEARVLRLRSHLHDLHRHKKTDSSE